MISFHEEDLFTPPANAALLKLNATAKAKTIFFIFLPSSFRYRHLRTGALLLVDPIKFQPKYCAAVNLERFSLSTHLHLMFRRGEGSQRQ